MNTRVLGKGLELLSVNVGRFSSNYLHSYLHSDDTALMADSDEKLCCLVSELVEYAQEES